MHNREHSDWLHHSVVWELHSQGRKVLRSVVRSAEFIIGRELTALQDIFHT